jgi:hypothetical protein
MPEGQSRRPSFAERCEKIKAEKAGIIQWMEFNKDYKMSPHYLCEKHKLCQVCYMRQDGFCKGCDHLKCMCVVCPRLCYSEREEDQYCKFERCGNENPDWRDRETHHTTATALTRDLPVELA